MSLLAESKLVRGGADPTEIHVNAGESLSAAIGQLESTGGDIYIHGNPSVETRAVLGDGIRIFRAGRTVTITALDGNPAIEVTGNDFELGEGFWFEPQSPTADQTVGIMMRGKRSILKQPKFRQFGNQIATELALADISCGIVYDSGGVTEGVWADWNHLYSPHFEFMYGGLLLISVSNVMVSNLVARGSIGLGGGVRSHMTGSPAGAPVRINGIWTAHCEGPALQFTQDSGITREGGNIISNWTNEPGAGNLGTAAYVESDGNLFTGAITFLGGDVGFAWATGSQDNVVDSVVTRNAQGGVGPAVDTGPVGSQIYTYP